LLAKSFISFYLFSISPPFFTKHVFLLKNPPFFSRFQLTAVAAKNRSKRASMWKENQCFPKKILPLSN